jgi:dihydrodipicolinate synthase/N-acetylneuraminate lyase
VTIDAIADVAECSEGRGLDLYAIAPTLFDEDGRVDTGAMRAAAEWMAGHGIPDLLLTGSYGEFQSLSDDERVEILRVIRAVPEVRTVMACAAGTSTEGTVRLGRRLADEGADLVMVAAPIAAEVSYADVLRHFELMADGLDALVVYNNPVFGTDLTADELAGIVAVSAYRAVKQGTQSLRSLTQSIQAVHEASAGSARLLAASDLTAVPSLVAGADGLTSTNSWAFPCSVAAIVRAAGCGDWGQARRVAASLEPYFTLARRCGQPRTVKAAMALRGLPGAGRVRPPYVPLGPDEMAELEHVLEKCDAELDLLGVGASGGYVKGAP